MYGHATHALAMLPANGNELVIVAQNLIEFWAVATRPIVNNGLGITTSDAAKELTKLKTLFTVLPDSADILPRWEQLVIKYDVIGKQSHDARLVAAMAVHKASHLLTFNDRDFKRFTEITVVNPRNIT
jgi:predicted nucleic acid-binding protein